VRLGRPESIRDRLLITAKHNKESIEHLRFILLIKAALLDKTDASSVNDFNDTIKKLSELENPGEKRKQKTPEDVKNIIQDFTEHFKLKKEKLKNFKRAD
jgi:hypothetical protein